MGARLDALMSDFRSGRLRGFCVSNASYGTRYTVQDFIDLAATGANVIRVPIVLRTVLNGAYEWPVIDMAYARAALGIAQGLGLRVILVLCPLPVGADTKWWASESLKVSLVDTWRRIAAEFKTHPALQAYDILNEPAGATYDKNIKIHWSQIARRLALALRAEDPETPIMIEPAWWGLPTSFWLMPPITDVPGLVFSFHLYYPDWLTHQGISPHPIGQDYPSARTDKTALYATMLEARKYAALTNAPMFVGEFSCARWAPPGAAVRWLTDALSLFAAERWCWTYHDWRGADPWDAEIDQSVPKNNGTPAHRRSDSPAITVLRAAMK